MNKDFSHIKIPFASFLKNDKKRKFSLPFWSTPRSYLKTLGGKVKNLPGAKKLMADTRQVATHLTTHIKSRLHPATTDQTSRIQQQLLASVMQRYRDGETPVILYVGEDYEGACNSQSCPSFAFAREITEKNLETLMLDAGNPFEEDIEGSTALDYGFNELMAGQNSFEDVVRCDFKTDLQYVLAGSEAVREATLNAPPLRTRQIFSALQLVYHCVVLRVDADMARLLLRQVPDALTHIVLDTCNSKLLREMETNRPAFADLVDLHPSVSPAQTDKNRQTQTPPQTQTKAG